MTGSVLDGEDLVQETLTQAFERLSNTDEDDVQLRPWLFTIAHHRCVDFLRRRNAPSDLEDWSEQVMEIDTDIEDRQLAAHAFSQVVLRLPPRERAAIVLKEMLGYSLTEIAEILETSIGAVKAALHRGRDKLADAKETKDLPPARAPLPELVSVYLEAFNRRDWTALQSMLEGEVQCDLVGWTQHVGRDAVANNYLSNYAKLSYTWRLAIGEIDGEPAILCLRKTENNGWTAHHAIRLDWRDASVSRIRDYVHVPYLLEGAHVTTTEEE